MRDEPANRHPPEDADDRRPIAVGLVLWLLATVVVATVAAIREIPAEALWTCVAGLVLGVAGLLHVSRRRRMNDR